MNALILVGGYGTRLRPLTLTTPKPLISFCNKPILEHQILNLAKCGVKEIILAIAYKPTDIKNAISELEKKHNVKILYSVEDEPLGTGAPIKLAENYLNKYEDFFVFNSDIICPFPLKEMMEFHKQNKSLSTILVKEVDNPSAFGVVITEGHKIIKFEEKPAVPKSSLINAGIYILNRKIIERIPKRQTSLEKEIFPKLANERILFFFKLNDFWADIGKPLDFLRGQELYLQDLKEKKKKKKEITEDLYLSYNLEYNKETKKDSVYTNLCDEKNLFISFDTLEEYHLFNSSTVTTTDNVNNNDNNDNNNKNNNNNNNNNDINNNSNNNNNTSNSCSNTCKNTLENVLVDTNIEGTVLISSKATIKKNCILGDNVVIGENVLIEEGCRIKNSCIMNNSKIKAYSYIENSIIGSKSVVGSWSRIEGLSVLGESVVLNPELFLNNVFILPFKEVSKSVYEKGSVIM